MTYDDVLDWLEDEYNMDFEKYTDISQLYEEAKWQWQTWERKTFPINFNNFVDQFEEEENFISIGQDVTNRRLEELISSLF